MKRNLVKFFSLVLIFSLSLLQVSAQKKSAKKSTKAKTTANISSAAQIDSVQTPAPPPPPPAPAPPIKLPIVTPKKSMRQDEAVDTREIKDRTPLAYEHLRAEDAVYRHKIWREIDTREKINLPFRYSADENNGNQRFISILIQALQDSSVTAFSSVDDRFTTPMTKAELAKAILGDEIDVPVYDSVGNLVGSKKQRNEINLDSFYRFRIKEEVIFDKESSRLFWRILGIAPVKNVITSQGINLGPTELFWIYYPDMRPIFSKYEVYNGKNYGGRMSWEELFESRMFSGRIIKSSMDNPKDLQIRSLPGLDGNGILQLYEGENIKEKIFNYEQDLWSY